jgi:hypothetical protein
MITFAVSRWLPAALVAAGAFLTLAPPVRAGDKVQVTLVTILATTRHEPVDPRLVCIAKEVRKKNPKLRGFKLVNMNRKSLRPGEEWTVKLLEGQEATVVIHQGPNKNNRVELKVDAPLQGEIVYDTVCGKCLPIVTRYKTKGKQDRLIIAVMVRPCRKP